MTGDPRQIQWLRQGCDAAEAAVADLERIVDPSLWTGPAATAYRVELHEHLTVVRPAVGAARSAADQLEAATAAEGGG